jgi:hypothetical protein
MALLNIIIKRSSLLTLIDGLIELLPADSGCSSGFIPGGCGYVGMNY